MSTHNPDVAKLAAQSGIVEMILFSVNPAFDMLPASEEKNYASVLANAQRQNCFKQLCPSL